MICGGVIRSLDKHMFRTGRPRSYHEIWLKLCQVNKWQQMQRWERIQKGFRFGNHFPFFFCVVVYWGLLWHFRRAHTIHPFYFTYVHLYYHFVLFLEFPARFFFITFFHIDFLVFSVMFSFQFFVPFSLMIMFWYFFVLVYVQACSNLHQGSWLHPKDGVFFSCSIKAAGLWMFTGLCKVLSQF